MHSGCNYSNGIIDSKCADCGEVGTSIDNALYSDRDDRSACEIQPTCGQGQYISPASTTVKQTCGHCPENTFKSTNDDRVEQCTPQTFCESGQFISSDSKNAARTCTPCPANTYQPGPSLHRLATCRDQRTCGKGQSISADTKTAERTCSACLFGTFQPSSDHRSTDCVVQDPCFAGTKFVDSSVAERTCENCEDEDSSNGTGGTHQPEASHKLLDCTANRECAYEQGFYTSVAPTLSSDRICAALKAPGESCTNKQFVCQSYCAVNDGTCRSQQCRGDQHCCDSHAAAVCKTACDTAGHCFPTLEMSPGGGAAWNSATVAALNWPERINNNEVISGLQTPPASLLDHVGRLHLLQPSDEFSAVKRGDLTFLLRWGRPHLGSMSGEDDDGAPNPSSDAAYAKYIGSTPPDGITAAGQGDDPGVFSVDTGTGSIVGQPKRTGNFTMWMLLEDTEPGLAGMSAYGSTPDSVDQMRNNQMVVAVWNVEVTGKPTFKVLDTFERSSDAQGFAASQYITDRSPRLDCVVGSTYRIAPIDLETFETENANSKYDGSTNGNGAGKGSSAFRFSLRGAPDGFFIEANSGEILGIPTEPTDGDIRATLWVSDASGEEAFVQAILISVKAARLFEVDLLKNERIVVGDEYTDPEKKPDSYTVNKNYLIAPYRLGTQTQVSAGTVTDIKYTLLGAPASWFISADTGIITGRFNESNVYNFSVVAIDAGEQLQTMENFSFTVEDRRIFGVVAYDRDDGVTNGTTLPTNVLSCEIGATCGVPPINLATLKTANAAPGGKLQFTLKNAPDGFFVSANTGEILGVPKEAATNKVAELFVLDGDGREAWVEDILISVKSQLTFQLSRSLTKE